jgi:HSP20 family protein
MAVSARRGAPTTGARRWEPSRDLEQVRRLLEETFGSIPAALAEANVWVPAVDIEEQDDAYLVEAEVPGAERDDIDIELVGNELTISGEIKEKERAGILRKRTRRVGKFEFQVLLPDHVDSERVDANLKGGVLTVKVPKAERAQRRRIEVSS